MEPLPLYQDPDAQRAFTLHHRLWQKNTYVYPVVSRRSKGISIGINLNPDKACNFDCTYCSVDRTIPGPTKTVDLGRLQTELQDLLARAQSGEIYDFDPFDKIPAELRRINDIAFSGDGEPTTAAKFLHACQLAATVKAAAGLPQVKLVLITNATMFHRPSVRQALALLDQNQGEIWAKLDAGTQAYYELVDRSSIPLTRILQNITHAAQVRPLVIQTLFLKLHGRPMPPEEIAAYIARLQKILHAGGQIKLVQAYTVARTTTETYATALTLKELETLTAPLRAALPQIPLELYP